MIWLKAGRIIVGSAPWGCIDYKPARGGRFLSECSGTSGLALRAGSDGRGTDEWLWLLIEVVAGSAIVEVLLVKLGGEASLGLVDGRRGPSLSLRGEVKLALRGCLLGDGCGRYGSVKVLLIIGVFLEEMALLLEHDLSVLLADLHCKLMAMLMEIL